MSFLDHLGELRRRLIISLVAVGVAMFASFTFSQQLFDWLAQPLYKALPQAKVGIIFTGVGEALNTYVWISVAAGIVLVSPILFWQFWAFVAPGLHRKEKKTLFAIAIASSGLLLAGVAFAYYVALPLVLRFFLSFATPQLLAAPRMGEYLSFVAWFALIFGLTFQTPLIMALLAWIGILSPKTLTGNRSYAIVGIFVLAAIVTPPDVVSMMLVAIPLLVLFEMGIVAAKMLYKDHNT
ncbi:MAG: twin-arginine translocase subunit TatC [Nitrospirae bacterium]|nr:twin-arginine translocase subunit TatC [Nitrospirota bacterium]